jgi:hypothetical protein
MGLDMYLHKRPKGEEIGYWRKHNRLHGWMENLWEKRGNTAEFNCVDLVLDNDDLNQLQKDIEEKELPTTTGFFFGGDSYDHYDADMQQEDLNIIKNAKQAIKDGYDIVYSCWW